MRSPRRGRPDRDPDAHEETLQIDQGRYTRVLADPRENSLPRRFMASNLTPRPESSSLEIRPMLKFAFYSRRETFLHGIWYWRDFIFFFHLVAENLPGETELIVGSPT